MILINLLTKNPILITKSFIISLKPKSIMTHEHTYPLSLEPRLFFLEKAGWLRALGNHGILWSQQVYPLLKQIDLYEGRDGLDIQPRNTVGYIDLATGILHSQSKVLDRAMKDITDRLE